MRVALVHDYLTQRGGAERVVLSLHRLFPDAPIYTSVFDRAGTFPELARLDVRTSPLQRLPHRGSMTRALLPLYAVAFERLRLRGYDLVVSSSSGWAHGTRAPGAFHLCYCYTPARWLYRTDRYLGDAGGPVPTALRPVLRPVLAGLRDWDRRAARRPDLYVAMSRPLASWIHELYGRAPRVIHPPVDTGRIADARPETAGATSDYYLVVSRLLPYKRVELAIRACAARGNRLVVVGTGPGESSLRDVAREIGAADQVEFRGHVDEGQLNQLLHGCTAVIQAGEEDFGLVPLEANAAGRPAVAFAGGGALETVVAGATGVLFADPTVDALRAALDDLEGRQFSPQRLRDHAASFGEERFHRELVLLLDEHGLSL